MGIFKVSEHGKYMCEFMDAFYGVEIWWGIRNFHPPSIVAPSMENEESGNNTCLAAHSKFQFRFVPVDRVAW